MKGVFLSDKNLFSFLYKQNLYYCIRILSKYPSFKFTLKTIYYKVWANQNPLKTSNYESLITDNPHVRHS